MSPVRSIGMPALRRPSLLRRVCIALLTSFVLAWVVVAVVQLHDARERARRDGAAMGEVLANTVARAVDAAQAARLVAAAQDLAQGMRQRQGLEGRVRFELRDAASGFLVFPDAPLRGGSPPAGCPSVSGRAYPAGTWELRIIVDACAAVDSGASVARDTTRYLVIAFPFVLVPGLVAAWLSLRPLRELSRRIDARALEDLSPLALPTRHAELEPLVDALNRLLARARAGVEREHAFVHDAAHELRTPIATIAAQAHVLMRASDADERKDAAGHLSEAVARSSRLIQQLLTLARLDAVTHDPPTTENLAALVRQELSWRMRPAEACPAEWAFDGPDELHALTDGLAFRAALGNLVDNAVRHGGPDVRVHVRLWREVACVVLQVLDDGPGISPAERDRACERFHRGATRDAEGSGLGLAIVHQAVQRVGGRLVLHEGLEGRGCGVTVTLPMA